MTQPGGRPDDSYRRYEIRVFDPATAVRLPGEQAPEATAYRGNVLMITAEDRDDAEQIISVVDEVAAELELRRSGPGPFDRDERDSEHDRRAALLRAAAELKMPLVFPYFLEPAGDGPAAPVDAWTVLQRLRARNDALRDRLVWITSCIPPHYSGIRLRWAIPSP